MKIKIQIKRRINQLLVYCKLEKMKNNDRDPMSNHPSLTMEKPTKNILHCFIMHNLNKN